MKRIPISCRCSEPRLSNPDERSESDYGGQCPWQIPRGSRLCTSRTGSRRKPSVPPVLPPVSGTPGWAILFEVIVSLPSSYLFRCQHTLVHCCKKIVTCHRILLVSGIDEVPYACGWEIV